MKRRKRRLILFILILIVLGLSYYFVEYSYKKELEQITKSTDKQENQLFENLTPSETISLLQEKIDSLEHRISTQQKYIPFYSTPVQAYDKIIQTLNLINQKTEINIDRLSTENYGDFKVEKFQIKGESKFSDLFHLINLFETSPELYRIHLKEIKQTYSTNEKGKLEEKVLFTLFLDAIYTTNDKFRFISEKERPNLRSVFYISDYFESLIKIEIPPNDAGLFEVDGAKLLAILPDAVYLVDKKGNAFTLAEGDEVYLGYLTKINYQNHTCEFLLNKGGILERVTLKIDDKEELR